MNTTTTKKETVEDEKVATNIVLKVVPVAATGRSKLGHEKCIRNSVRLDAVSDLGRPSRDVTDDKNSLI